MKLFVDTNWLVAAYFPEKFPTNSAIVDNFSDRHDYPWIISQPVSTECSTVFRNLAREQNPVQWVKFRSEFGISISLAIHSWDAIAAKAHELIQFHAHKTRLGTMDMLILASALKAEATHFLSFDTNSNLRALASVLKLKVFPELTADDRRRIAALR